MTDTELAGLVCARICHDLVNPIGAVMNGSDLIQEIGAQEAGEEIKLVETSARRAAAILKFHRLAFGPAGAAEATLTRAELRGQAEEMLQGPRITLNWSAPEGPPIALPVVRLVYLMLLAGRSMQGMDGTLKVVLPSAGSLPLAVIAEGNQARANDDQRRWLTGAPGAAPDSRQVEFALIGPAAAATGSRIELKEASGQLALHTVPV